MSKTNPLFSVVEALGKPGAVSSDFDLNPKVSLPENRILRPAAVLVPFLITPAGMQIILTKRASALKHHPGQIAFPGGKVDPTDPTIESAALREAREEIGLPEENVEVLGNLPSHETVTGFTVNPILGRIRAEFVAKPEPGEVDEVFAVPLAISQIFRIIRSSRGGGAAVCGDIMWSLTGLIISGARRPAFCAD